MYKTNLILKLRNKIDNINNQRSKFWRIKLIQLSWNRDKGTFTKIIVWFNSTTKLWPINEK